jgi:hypothetical protein
LKIKNQKESLENRNCTKNGNKQYDLNYAYNKLKDKFYNYLNEKIEKCKKDLNAIDSYSSAITRERTRNKYNEVTNEVTQYNSIFGENSSLNKKLIELSEKKPETTNNFPNRERIVDFISNYYTFIKDERFNELGSLLADNVKRYFSAYNLTRSEVINNYKDYDRMFKVHDKKFMVDWSSLNLTNEDNNVFVTYILDYVIDREDKTKPSKYKIKMMITINNRYQIIGIYEKILSSSK